MQFMNSVIWLLSALILGWAVLGGYGLRLLSLDVPTAVVQGEPAWLNCSLDLEKEDLYSVKWYRNDDEFYRYIPRHSSSEGTYDVPGIHVNLEKSVQGNVYLETTDLNTEGMYRCEASAEYPSFQTVEGEKYINVYSIPKEGPTIYGTHPRYEVGNFVNLTCRSAPSKPAASLQWFINGKEAPSDILKTYTIRNLNGLQTTSLGLEFFLNPRYMQQSGDSIKLRCTSIVSQTYFMSSEELVVGDKLPEISSTAGTKLPLISQFYSRDGPFITGGRTNYRVGDYLKLNCTSRNFRHPPILLWLLNDRQVDKRYVIQYSLTKQEKGSSIIGLQFAVQPQHFDENGEMRLKCTATLFEEINRRSEETILGSNHRSSGLHVPVDDGKVSAVNNGKENNKNSLFLTFMVLMLIVAAAR